MKKYMLASAILASACALYAQAPAQAPQQPAAQPAAQQQAQQPAAAIKVEKIVTAASVEKRDPVGEATSFAAGQVYTWTKVTAEQTPAKIKHVYYKDGKNVREIELAVATNPCRTWSVKNVTPGSWKVEVTDEAGTVLSSAEFTVTAAAPEAAKPAEAAPAQTEKK